MLTAILTPHAAASAMAVYLICFFASVAGAICGIGGGVIIKPALDALGIFDVRTVSFLSGCTVLAMTSYAVLRAKLDGGLPEENGRHRGQSLLLAAGSAFGGIAGKWAFVHIAELYADKSRVGAVQAACLLAVTVFTLWYTLHKDRIKTRRTENRLLCFILGLGLGILSSFLGIGGGPINLVLLFYFFSMDTKEAVENSLYIIFVSQLASLLYSALTASIPEFALQSLVLMVAGGISGGIAGRRINRKLQEEKVLKLFIFLMLLMMVINLYNIYQFVF